MFLVSGTQSNEIGYFPLSIDHAAVTMGRGNAIKHVRNDFDVVITQLGWKYDADTGVVWNPTFFRDDPPDNPDHVYGNVTRAMRRMPRSTLDAEFRNHTKFIDPRFVPAFQSAVDVVIGDGPQRSDQGHEQPLSTAPCQTPSSTDGQSGAPPNRFENNLTTTTCDDDGFSTFWNLYPRKGGRRAEVEKAWKALAPDQALQRTICDAVRKQRSWPEHQRDHGRWIPYPLKWLKEERWEDESAEYEATVLHGRNGRTAVEPGTLDTFEEGNFAATRCPPPCAEGVSHQEQEQKKEQEQKTKTVAFPSEKRVGDGRQETADKEEISSSPNELDLKAHLEAVKSRIFAHQNPPVGRAARRRRL